MAIVRRTESQVPTLRDEMNRLFDSFFGTAPAFLATPGRELMGAAWMPAIDVSETPEGVTVTAELPGIRPEDVQIDLTGSVLTLRGEKKEEKDDTGKNWHRVERSYGSFVRSVQLPDSIDPEKAKARAENGVLRIDIAKSEASRPRSIKVDVRKT